MITINNNVIIITISITKLDWEWNKEMKWENRTWVMMIVVAIAIERKSTDVTVTLTQKARELKTKTRESKKKRQNQIGKKTQRLSIFVTAFRLRNLEWDEWRIVVVVEKSASVRQEWLRHLEVVAFVEWFVYSPRKINIKIKYKISFIYIDTVFLHTLSIQLDINNVQFWCKPVLCG